MLNDIEKKKAWQNQNYSTTATVICRQVHHRRWFQFQPPPASPLQRGQLMTPLSIADGLPQRRQHHSQAFLKGTNTIASHAGSLPPSLKKADTPSVSPVLSDSTV